MNCLEFKRLALSDPNARDVSFIQHSENCADCLKYVGGIQEMDSKLAASLDSELPSDFKARLELNHLLASQASSSFNIRYYAKVASIAMIVLVTGFFIKDQFQSPSIESNDIASAAVVKMINHMEQNPLSPVWGADQANRTIKTLMASYDSSLKLKDISRLQFTKICPMDRKTNALHANLDTDHGQITFAYIKGNPVGEVSNKSYKGYMTRIKPVQGGSLMIISRNMYAMEDADATLKSAMYWDL